LEGRAPDANGWILPDGFTSKVIALGGEPVPGTTYRWHPIPDGAGCFPDDDGGWLYVSNSEVTEPLDAGGVSVVRFDPTGAIVDAYSILTHTTANCSGGTTPWKTWLSCEEHATGVVWECDPFGKQRAVKRLAMGRFRHEAAAVDATTQAIYLTEDEPDGLVYRFTPNRWGDLSVGTLEAASIDADHRLHWVPVLDPLATKGPSRYSAPGATTFNGGEGITLRDSGILVTTKGDNLVQYVDLEIGRHSILWDKGEPLVGVDQLVVDYRSNDVYVCEDGGNMEVVLIAADGAVFPFARLVGHDTSELSGMAFNPGSTRLYVVSQRGNTPKSLRDLYPQLGYDHGLGVVFEISGPFHPSPVAVNPTVQSESSSVGGDVVDQSEPSLPVAQSEPTLPVDLKIPPVNASSAGAPLWSATGAGAIALAALVALRRRRSVTDTPPICTTGESDVV
jgi:hypothetical protein